MESKGPIGDLGGSADDFCVLARHLHGIRSAASKEIEVDNSSDGIVFEGCSGSGLVDLHIHAIGIEEEHAVRTGGTMLDVDGVASVQVGVIGDTVSIPGPESAGIVVGRQTETVGVFAEAIEVRTLGEVCLYADVLRLEDYGMALGGEENLLCFGSEDGEGKGFGAVVELYFVLLSWLCRWARNNRLRDLIALDSGVGDCDVNPGV